MANNFQEMSKNPLPTRLGKEPLIDAVFEVRFTTTISAADILPGYLRSKLGGDVRIERLPISSLPSEVREQDPNLANQPLVRMFWKNFIIVMGDKSLGVACVVPYPGWAVFRAVILELVTHLVGADIVGTIERFSLKYVDILEMETSVGVAEWLNLSLDVGGYKLKDRPFQLHIEIPRESFAHALLIGAPAKAQTLDGKVREGTILSVDTFSLGELPSFEQFVNELPGRIEALHEQNKQMFFDCLTPAAIDKLEPSYE